MNLLSHPLIVLALPLFALLVGCNERTNAASSPAPRPASKPPTVAETGPFTAAVTHTDAEWKTILTPDQYAVLREKNTERPFTGQYDDFFKPGTYSCAACGTELFASDTKFDSGCGWPSFFTAKAANRVKLVPDFSFGSVRVEVVCANCGGHLGHVFDDAPQTRTGQRFCINSVSLKFTPAATQPATAPAK